MFKSLNKKVKKHQVVIENREENELKHNEETKTKHIRSMTVNISKGLFGRKNNKSLKNRTSPTTEDAVQQPNGIKLHKASVNYEDMEEEEKFDQPKKKSTPGKFSFDDAKTEATD